MKLRTRSAIAAMVTAAAVGSTGAILLPAASARTATHSLAFTSVSRATVQFSKTARATEGKDVSEAGKVIGYDVSRLSYDPKTGTVSVGIAIDLKGGFLYGVLRASDPVVAHGIVTGGTGAFAGARGTITARDKKDSKTAITIKYHE